MNKIVYRILTWAVLPAIILTLLYLVFASVSEPIDFNDEKARRSKVAIQRLKDIRELQEAFKSAHGRYAPTMDSLILFYNNGEIEILKNIGSNDDSAAVAHTAEVKKMRESRGLKGEKLAQALNKRYEELGDTQLVFQIKTKVPVKQEVFVGRTDVAVDSLRYIPFSGGDTVLMETTIKKVSGVNVPLFEASMPYKQLLKGMDNQLRINLDADQEDRGYFKGLQVGSVTTPNNNAGNWE